MPSKKSTGNSAEGSAQEAKPSTKNPTPQRKPAHKPWHQQPAGIISIIAVIVAIIASVSALTPKQEQDEVARQALNSLAQKTTEQNSKIEGLKNELQNLQDTAKKLMQKQLNVKAEDGLVTATPFLFTLPEAWTMNEEPLKSSESTFVVVNSEGKEMAWIQCPAGDTNEDAWTFQTTTKEIVEEDINYKTEFQIGTPIEEGVQYKYLITMVVTDKEEKPANVQNPDCLITSLQEATAQDEETFKTIFDSIKFVGQE
ncbi:MAG: hypothetical protein ABIH21_02545 [Patescibacteria group bacterium]